MLPLLALLPTALAWSPTPTKATATVDAAGAHFQWRLLPTEAEGACTNALTLETLRDGAWLPSGLANVVASPTDPCLLSTTVPLDAAQAGAYEWHVRMQDSTFTLAGAVPAPQIDAAARKLDIWDDVLLNHDGEAFVSVTEGSNGVAVPALTATWLGASGPDGAQSPGKLTCTGGPFHVAAGGSLPLACTATGFDIGVSTGTLRLSGAPLSAPVLVPITVDKRLERWVLFAAIGVGLLGGWWLRERGEPRIKLLEAQRTALRRSAALQRAIAQSPDGIVRARLQDAWEALQRTLQGSTDAEELTTAISAAQSAAQEADDDLDARRNTVRVGLEAQAPLLSKRWRLPEPAATALVNIQADRDAAVDALARGDADAAQARLDALRRRVGELPAVVEQTWAELRRRLWSDPPTPWPAELAVLLAPLTAAPTLAADAPATELLTALHDAWEPALRALPAVLARARRTLLASLDLAPPDVAARLADTKQALTSLGVPADGAPAFQLLLGTVRPLCDRIAATFRAAPRGAQAAPLLDAGDYEAAAKALVPPPVSAVPLSFGVPDEDEPTTAPRPAPTPPVPPDNSATPLPGLTRRSIAGVGSEASLALALAGARRIYQIGTGLAILLLGSMQFWDSWTGALPEVLKAFAWGLGADLAATTAFALARTMAPPPPDGS